MPSAPGSLLEQALALPSVVRAASQADRVWRGRWRPITLENLPGPVEAGSPNLAEGKTATVTNLAAVLAEGGLRVLVVNCDFRPPLIQRYLLTKRTATWWPPTATS